MADDGGDGDGKGEGRAERLLATIADERQPPSGDDAALGALADLCGRLLLTHVIDLELAAQATGLSTGILQALMDHGQLSAKVDGHDRERLALFVNILLRLEVRCGHDPRLVRLALRQLFTDDVQLSLTLVPDMIATLRRMRAGVDTLALPGERWWRVGHS